MQLIHQYLLDSVNRFPEKPAIICDDRIVSYKDFLRKIDSLADLLLEQGLSKGDRMGILLRDKTEFLVASYAVMKMGAIAVPIPEASAQMTILQTIKDCTPSLVITSAGDLLEYPQLRAKLKCNLFLIEETRHSADYSHSIVLRGNSIQERQERQDQFTSQKRDPQLNMEGSALILYTAGTGGRRKGVSLSQKNLVQASLNINEFTEITSETREFISVPLTRSFGFGRCRCLFFVGGTAILSNGMLNPVFIVQNILKHRCNALSLIPSVFTNLFGYLEPLIVRIGAQITFIELGGSSMPVAQKKHIMGLFPNAKICMHYGITEAPRSTFLDFRKEQEKLETAGRATPHVELTILNEANTPLPSFTSGEIAVRGDHVMQEYWNNRELTDQSLTPDRWCKTGDYGFLDEEGYLHVLGRNDEMIVMDGMKFSPIEIEEPIRKLFPDNELCIVGIPDPAGILGEIPVLCYVARDGKTITASELSRTLSNKIDRNKIPRIVYRIDSNGDKDQKLERKELRKQFLENFSQSALQEK